MTVAILDDTAALEALAPEWHSLWQRNEGATPFQSPHWLIPWWSAFGTGAPRVAVLRQGGVLRGMLPAYVLQEADGPKLLPIGAGTSDYLDVLGDGATPLLAALLARAAADGVGRCDLIEVPPWSTLRSAAVPQGWAAAWHEGEPCPVLHLHAIPASIRRKLRMSRHRADRAGGWSMETAGSTTCSAMLDSLVALHQARWSAGSEPGVLADPAVLLCLHRAVPALLKAGLLRLVQLRVGGKVAAVILAMLSPGQIYLYLTGYDLAQSFVSPGTLLLGAMLEEATAEGRTEARFLRGREGYKYAWGAVDQVNATLTMIQRS